MSARRQAIRDKIAANVRRDPATGCAIWTGGTSGSGKGGGYPRMCLDGGTVAAHRARAVTP